MKKKLLPILAIVIFGCIALSGCTKDEILTHYNGAIQIAGSEELTSKHNLVGNRKRGADDYTGTYTADYKKSSATEYIFGGTSIDREAGKDITVTCTLTVTDGTAKVFWISGSNDPATLIETSGTYSEDITLPDGGNYFGIECENFTGSVELNIK